MRFLVLCCSASLLVLAACAGSDPAATGPGSAGAGSVTAGAGSVTAGAAGAPLAGAGAGPVAGGAGGAPNSTAGAAGAVNRAGAGGNDSGNLFNPDMSVKFDPAMGGGGGGGPPKGAGNMTTSNFSGGKVVFTQATDSSDVTVVVAINCSNGEHSLAIRDGFSCDSDLLEKGVWDGKRGLIGDKGTITCSNGKGNMTYTRKGDDPATSWSVASQLPNDLSLHVLVITSSTDPNGSHQGCGNFF